MTLERLLWADKPRGLHSNDVQLYSSALGWYGRRITSAARDK